ACGSSTGASGVSGRHGSTEDREGRTSHGQPTNSSFDAIRSCVPGSHNLGPARRVGPEEPTAAILHRGVWYSQASCHSSGRESRQQRSPVTVVVISSGGKGD